MFNISPPPTLPGLTERIVKITGDVDHLMRAVALVVTKLRCGQAGRRRLAFDCSSAAIVAGCPLSKLLGGHPQR